MVKFTSNSKEIEKKLKSVVKVVAKTNLQALEEIGLRGTDIVKRNVVEDTGRLRNSMSYTLNGKVKNPDSAFDTNDELRKSEDKDKVIIGTNVKYGPKVEYLATNGSQGYMLLSYKQMKPIAKKIWKAVFKRKGF